jgi:3-hydroxyisobutyrate dehydrogenase-like beta-hydroxyacid dehydrogenase
MTAEIWAQHSSEPDQSRTHADGYNRTRSRAEAFRPFGAKIAETPPEAASDVEALIAMLADDRAMEEIFSH